MALRIGVTTRRETFELRKKRHPQLGYRIEDEQAVPGTGLFSFIAVKEDRVREILDYGANP